MQEDLKRAEEMRERLEVFEGREDGCDYGSPGICIYNSKTGCSVEIASRALICNPGVNSSLKVIHLVSYTRHPPFPHEQGVPSILYLQGPR